MPFDTDGTLISTARWERVEKLALVVAVLGITTSWRLIAEQARAQGLYLDIADSTFREDLALIRRMPSPPVELRREARIQQLEMIAAQAVAKGKDGTAINASAVIAQLLRDQPVVVDSQVVKRSYDKALQGWTADEPELEIGDSHGEASRD